MQKILNFDQSFHNFLRKNRLILVESRHLNFHLHFLKILRPWFIQLTFALEIKDWSNSSGKMTRQQCRNHCNISHFTQWIHSLQKIRECHDDFVVCVKGHPKRERLGQVCFCVAGETRIRNAWNSWLIMVIFFLSFSFFVVSFVHFRARVFCPLQSFI